MDTVFPAPPAPFVPVRGTDAVFPVRRIWCIGFNYASHNKEMGRPEDIKPVFFSKPADAIVWADSRREDSIAEIPYPQATDNLHYEVELVIAIGPTDQKKFRQEHPHRRCAWADLRLCRRHRSDAPRHAE